MVRAARATTGGISGARSAATRTAAALSRTMSRRGPGSPAKMAVRIERWWCVASCEGLDGGAGKTGVFGREGGEGDDAVVDLGDLRGAGDGDLVEAADGAVGRLGGSVDDEGVAGAEQGHGSATSGTACAA